MFKRVTVGFMDALEALQGIPSYYHLLLRQFVVFMPVLGQNRKLQKLISSRGSLLLSCFGLPDAISLKFKLHCVAQSFKEAFFGI